MQLFWFKKILFGALKAVGIIEGSKKKGGNGGEKKNRLFMCGSQSIYALYVEAIGCMWP